MPQCDKYPVTRPGMPFPPTIKRMLGIDSIRELNARYVRRNSKCLTRENERQSAVANCGQIGEELARSRLSWYQRMARMSLLSAAFSLQISILARPRAFQVDHQRAERPAESTGPEDFGKSRTCYTFAGGVFLFQMGDGRRGARVQQGSSFLAHRRSVDHGPPDDRGADGNMGGARGRIRGVAGRFCWSESRSVAGSVRWRSPRPPIQ